MSKWDGRFDGSYESSRYNDGTLETDIMNAGNGIWATSTEGLYRESDSRIDVWDPGDFSGHRTIVTTNKSQGRKLRISFLPRRKGGS